MRTASVVAEPVVPTPDAWPVDRLRTAEEPRTFEAIYTAHYRDVYRYVAVLAGSPDDVDDIVADTFERAIRAWHSDLLVPPRPVAWLLLTARRLVIDRWRRARTTIRRRVGMSSTRATAGEATTEFWLWIAALSEALGARQREVLVLRYQRDLSDEEIGRLMGLTSSGVRSLVGRALAVLREHPELHA